MACSLSSLPTSRVQAMYSSFFDASSHTPRTREVGNELREHATGGAYVNYMAEEGEDAVKATYEANLARLIEVKRKYDPDNFFSSNQNIRP